MLGTGPCYAPSREILGRAGSGCVLGRAVPCHAGQCCSLLPTLLCRALCRVLCRATQRTCRAMPLRKSPRWSGLCPCLLWGAPRSVAGPWPRCVCVSCGAAPLTLLLPAAGLSIPEEGFLGGGGCSPNEPHHLQVKRKLNLETDHQYIAESLPVGRGKPRNPIRGIGSAPSDPSSQPRWTLHHLPPPRALVPWCHRGACDHG